MRGKKSHMELSVAIDWSHRSAYVYRAAAGRLPHGIRVIQSEDAQSEIVFVNFSPKRVFTPATKEVTAARLSRRTGYRIDDARRRSIQRTELEQKALRATVALALEVIRLSAFEFSTSGVRVCGVPVFTMLYFPNPITQAVNGIAPTGRAHTNTLVGENSPS